MKLVLVRHLWGVDLRSGIEPFLERWKAVGYSALEVPLRLAGDRKEFGEVLSRENLGWISQVLTDGYDEAGGLRPYPRAAIDLHIDSLREQIEEALPYKPMFFNLHSGLDRWDIEMAVRFYSRTLELEKEYGVVLAHETHRQRYFGTPWSTVRLLGQVPDLKLTCDFSHWVCVSERLLQDMEDCIAIAAEHARHIHGRVGFEEGPQVPDPRAQAYKAPLKAHQRWWDMIWKAQKRAGLETSTFTPEFGPPPYLHTDPRTDEPLADLADVCDWMAITARNKFSELW